MNFTDEHKEVLERHKGHWETLSTAGFMRNVDRPVFDELQNVHNEALGPVHYTHWCPSCVADLVRILYTNYETWLFNQKVAATIEGGEQRAAANGFVKPHKKTFTKKR